MTDATNQRARVVIADPFPIVLLGVRKIIDEDPGLQIVGEALSMAALQEKATREVPDLILVDWSMASHDLEAMNSLLRSVPHPVALVFLTSSDDGSDKQTMQRLGARAVVSKRDSGLALRRALWTALERPYPADPANGEPGMEAPATLSDPEQRIQQLTRRERQIIPLVCGGMRNKKIANFLGIAESTVWHHLTAIFTKLQVEDRLGLAAFAYHHGLVTPHAAQLIRGESLNAQ